MSKYVDKLPYRIKGIPCLIGVVNFNYQKPDLMADNPWDYAGGYEIEYEILDRKGYVAGHWLESKVTSEDEIKQYIIDTLSND